MRRALDQLVRRSLGSYASRVRALSMTGVAVVGVALCGGLTPTASAQAPSDSVLSGGARLVRLKPRDPNSESSPRLLGRISRVTRDSLQIEVAPGVTAIVDRRSASGIEVSRGPRSTAEGVMSGALRGALSGLALGTFTYAVTKRAGNGVARDAAFTAGGAAVLVGALIGGAHPGEHWVALPR
jgi:hypothetical protein